MAAPMILLSKWAVANQVPRPTAKLWAQEGHIPGAELRPEARGPVWYVPEDAAPPRRTRGRPVRE